MELWPMSRLAWSVKTPKKAKDHGRYWLPNTNGLAVELRSMRVRLSSAREFDLGFGALQQEAR